MEHLMRLISATRAASVPPRSPEAARYDRFVRIQGIGQILEPLALSCLSSSSVMVDRRRFGNTY